MINDSFKFFFRIGRRIAVLQSGCWVHMPLGILIPCYFLAIVSILFCGSGKICLAFDEKAELCASGFDFGDSLLQAGNIAPIPAVSNGVYSFKFGENFASKIGSSRDKSIMLLSIERKPVNNQSHKKSATTAEQPNIRSSEMDIEDYHTVLLSLIPMYLVVMFWAFYMFFSTHNDKLSGAKHPLKRLVRMLGI